MFLLKYFFVLPMLVTLIFMFLGMTRARRAFYTGLLIQIGVIAMLMLVYMTSLGDGWWLIAHFLFVWLAAALYASAWWIGLVFSIQPMQPDAPIKKVGAVAKEAAEAARNTYNNLSPERQEHLKRTGVSVLKGGLCIAAKDQARRGNTTTAKILDFARRTL